jgi:hypothetical protein
MRYDDRLATALRLTPVGPGVARIQFRQLLDLLGTLPVEEQGDDRSGYMRLGELSGRIASADRAAILRQPCACARRALSQPWRWPNRWWPMRR